MKNHLLLILILFAICLACTFGSENSNKLDNSLKTKSSTDLRYLGLTDNVIGFTEAKYCFDEDCQDSLGKLSSKNIFFNEFGNIVKEYYYRTEKIIYQTKSYTYDDAQRIIEIKTSNSHNEITEQLKFIYNTKGLLIGQNIFDKNGDLCTHVKLKTNENGDIINIKHYNSLNNELSLEIKSEFDENNRNTRLNFIYDENNHQKGMIKYDFNGEILENHIYEFLCDNNGNWIKRYEKEKENFTHISIRKIEYKQ